jgi:hypothetical protein
MIISSINIRGLGGAVKRSTIKELIRKEKIQFLAVQETKMETISDSFCYGLWGGEDCQWVFLPSIGNSGGLLSIWCNKKVRKGMLLIGSAVIWSIWRRRNSILFENERGSVAEIVAAVKVSSWEWWLSRPASNQCMFYEWCAAPRLCML